MHDADFEVMESHKVMEISTMTSKEGLESKMLCAGSESLYREIAVHEARRVKMKL